MSEGQDLFEGEIRSAAMAIEQSGWFGADGLRVVTEAETRVLEALLAFAEEWIGGVAGALPNQGNAETAVEHRGVVAYDGQRSSPPGADGTPVVIALTTRPEFIEYVTIDGARFPTRLERDAGAVLHIVGRPERLLAHLARSLEALPEVSGALESAAGALHRVRK